MSRRARGCRDRCPRGCRVDRLFEHRRSAGEYRLRRGEGERVEGAEGDLALTHDPSVNPGRALINGRTGSPQRTRQYENQWLEPSLSLAPVRTQAILQFEDRGHHLLKGVGRKKSNLRCSPVNRCSANPGFMNTGPR